jgi:chromosome segregation ATPase
VSNARDTAAIPYERIAVPQISTDNRLSRADLTGSTISDEENERVQDLNQRIIDLREQLDFVEDWDLYESIPLKYNIMLCEDERRRIAADFQRKTERKIREAAEEARDAQRTAYRTKVDPIRDEIDWVCAKLGELVATARAARPQDRREIESLIRSYRKYLQELMARSGRVRAGARDIPAESQDWSPSDPRRKHRLRSVEGARGKRVRKTKCLREPNSANRRAADLAKILSLLLGAL